MPKIFFFICVWILVLSCSQERAGIFVGDINEFNSAVEGVRPGSIIIMENGNWENVELRFKGIGEKGNPIVLKAQTPGKVIISGQSNLAFSGEYIEISGLVFKNGFTPTGEVISFKTGKDELANNSRVTNCVIDNFTNPERFDGDTWVALYGKNNRFDHNSMIGKGNRGVTLAVKMQTEASRESDHIIEYNYFGPRQILGSNGGETMRIGTSHYSRSYSNTIVKNNYFDRTSGELEIVSNKSCGNQFINNVFFECKGTLTMRHGHHTLVAGNYFLGNRKANTGGIRVINENQTVKNNYIYGLTGYRFRSALTIMNGVPNSPINRYNQVTDSHVLSNIVIDSDHIQLCAGSDEERSAIPEESSFRKNIILTSTNASPFTIYDDISGIDFAENIVFEDTNIPFKAGFEKRPVALKRNENGLISPPEELLKRIEFSEVKLPVTKQEVGASYYSKDAVSKSFANGSSIKVASGVNTLLEAIKLSEAGDILRLENGGRYIMTKYAFISHPLTILTAPGEKAAIYSEKQTFFKIENGGALHFKNILFDGSESPDQAGNNVISTSKYSMNQNYALVIEDCEIKDLDKNHSFDFLKSYRHTFADSINIINSQMTNITGAVMTLDMEVEDLGIYNVENVKIINSTFTDVKHEIANVYRGGTDESTFGPIITIQDVEILNSGNGKRNKVGASLRFHGVQKLNVDNLKISDSRGIDLFMTNGEPITELSNIIFTNSTGLVTNDEPFQAKNIIVNK